VIQRNIVHRDLKLGNMVLNTRTRRVTITNFCLGKHLIGDRDLLRDQRGSPAYISPDVLSGTLLQNLIYIIKAVRSYLVAD